MVADTKEQQMGADLQKLTESYLKGKVKEDPTITEAQKQEFRELMNQVADQHFGKDGNKK